MTGDPCISELGTSVSIGTRFTTLFLLLTGSLLALNSLFLAPINPDAAYYLGVARRLGDGTQLYSQIPTSYPPLAFLIFSLVSFLTPVTTYYYAAIIIMLLIEVMSALCIYGLLQGFGLRARLARQYAALFFCLTLCFEGGYVVLEPFVNLSGLIALLLVIRFTTHSATPFLAGIATTAALFSKQYAVAYLVPILLFLVFEHSDSKCLLKGVFQRTPKRGIQFLASVLTSATIGLLLICSISGIDLSRLLSMLYPSGYISALRPITSDLFYLPIAICLILGTLLIVCQRQQFGRSLLILIATHLFFLPALWIRQFPHYYLLLLPFSVMCIAIMHQRLARLGQYSTVFVTASLVLTVTYSMISFVGPDFQNSRADQIIMGEELRKKLGSERSAILVADQTLILTADLLPPRSTQSYTYFQNLSESEFQILLNSENLLIYQPLDPAAQAWTSRLQRPIEDTLLLRGFSKESMLSGGPELWRRISDSRNTGIQRKHD